MYKHTYGKDLKLKAGYDTKERLGWASLWVSCFSCQGIFERILMEMLLNKLVERIEQSNNSTIIVKKNVMKIRLFELIARGDHKTMVFRSEMKAGKRKRLQ